MNNLIVAIAVFAITILGALFAVPYFIDWNGYRSAFEEEATRLLGRDVSVGGSVNLHLLPTPYFRFEKVRIADASTALEEPFFRAESLAIKISVPPIFRGVIEANEIEFERPVLRLALNDKDTWNWQSFGEALGSRIYVPANVALTSVRITDGVLAVHGPDGTERLRLDHLNGELSAPALDGPYRFRGVFGRPGAERELRLATARPEPDGSVRLRALLRIAETGSAYSLDGRLADLMGKPQLEGEITARLPVASLWHNHTAPRSRPLKQPSQDSGIETGSDGGESAFDVKATVKADAAGAVLSDLTLSFEQGGRPQLLTGQLTANWRQALALDIALTSRWLDLDRIGGTGEAAGPLASVIPIAFRLKDVLPGQGRSRATFSVDQANLGNDTIAGLHLRLARLQDNLIIEDLRVGMPGGSRGDFSGVISGPEESPELKGKIGLRGSNVARFLGWTVGGAGAADARGETAFGVRSELSIDGGRAVARNIVGDLGGTAIYGNAEYRWEGRPSLKLSLEGPKIDARAFVPRNLSLIEAFDFLVRAPDAKSNPGTLSARFGRVPADASIRVRAGQLMTGTRTYRDVAAEIELQGGSLRLPSLRLSGDDGFNVELEGEVADAASKPRGSLRGTVNMDSTSALTAVADLFGLPEAFRPESRRFEAAIPLRLAGTMVFGTRQPRAADLQLDGEANGAALKVSARFDGSTAGWRSGPASVTASLEGSESAKIVAMLAPGATADGGGTGAARVLLRAAGTPADGMTTLLTVDAPDLVIAFRGRLVAAEAGNRIAGDLEIGSAEAARIAALAGLAPAVPFDRTPISGTLKLSASEGKIGMERLAIRVGGSEVKGRMSVAPAGDRRRVEAHLDIDRLQLPALLTPLLDHRLAVTSAAEAAVTGRNELWSELPFDHYVLDAFEGEIRMKARRLELTEDVGLGDAAIDIALGGGKVQVRDITGTAFGGRLSGTVRIEKTAAGAELAGTTRLTGCKLEALTVDAKPWAAGPFDAEIAFSGRGLNPRAAVAALQGSGKMEIGAGARLAVLWPGAITVAAEAALRVEPDRTAEVLRQGLLSNLSGGVLPLGPNKIALEIADGQLRTKQLAIETAEGRATGTTRLDLRSLGLESEWRLEQKTPTNIGTKGALPGITVSYRGLVDGTSKIDPLVNAESLEREVTVRRMERDVEELERLRKLDEQRRRSETERLRRQFEVPPPPPPAAAPAGPAPVGRPG